MAALHLNLVKTIKEKRKHVFENDRYYDKKSARFGLPQIITTNTNIWPSNGLSGHFIPLSLCLRPVRGADIVKHSLL
jgi:hypothetical protein